MQKNNTEAGVRVRVLVRATHTVAALGTSREAESRSEPRKGAATDSYSSTKLLTAGSVPPSLEELAGCCLWT